MKILISLKSQDMPIKKRKAFFPIREKGEEHGVMGLSVKARGFG